MPNVGWGELMVILLIALLVFGPNRLPEMMRSFGKALRGFQEESSRAMEQLRSAADLNEPVTPRGVIDRPDGHVAGAEEAAEPVVLYNRNPAGVVPGESTDAAEPASEPKARPHAPRKRATAAKKTAKSTKKTPARRAASARRPAPAKRAAPPSALEALEDT